MRFAINSPVAINLNVLVYIKKKDSLIANAF